MTDQPIDWTQSTNPRTTANIREIRSELGDLQASLRRIWRDGEPNEAQVRAAEEAARLLGEVRKVLAPAGVDR